MSKTHTKSAFINFDLFEYIEETTNPTLAAAMARNVAWRVDSLIQNFSRQIFKTVREGLTQRKTETIASKLTRDGHAEIMMALRDLALSEEAFAEFSKGATGAMKNIKDLIRFRDHAHEVAHDLVALTFKWDGTINSFPLETIDQAFARPVEMKVGRDQRRRIKVSIDRRAQEYNLNEEERGHLAERRLLSAQSEMDEISETLDSQQDIVFCMFQFAIHADTDMDLADKFYHLDTSVQRALITSAMEAARRAETDATNSRRISDAEFDDICVGALRIERTLQGVLTSSQFAMRETAEA